jgi:DNA modification methylase
MKPNPKPESVKDRPTKAHEYLFLLSKKKQYYYDADALREPCTSTGGASFGKQNVSTEGTGAQSRRLRTAAERNHPLGKNKRDVWKIPVRTDFPGAHLALFPKDLVEPCIIAGCPKGGVVLDPMSGTATVGQVAEELGRDAVLIELNPVYVQMQKGRNAIAGVLDQKPADDKEEPENRAGWLF